MAHYFDNITKTDNGFTVDNLNRIYMKSYINEITECGGSVALLKRYDHPGYCQLFFKVIEKEDNNHYTIKLYEAITKDGEEILIKSDTEYIDITFFAHTDRPGSFLYLGGF